MTDDRSIEAWQSMLRELDTYEELRFTDMVVDAEAYVTAIGCDGERYFLFAGSIGDLNSASRLGPANSVIDRTGDGESSVYTYVGASGARTTVAREHIIQHYLSDSN